MTGAMDRRRLLIAMAGAFGAVSLPEALRAAMGPNDKFDLLIKGGEVLDPSSGLRGMRDIGIRHGVIEAVEFIGQLSVRIDPTRIVEVCDYLKRDEGTPFNYLSDLTCVHVPDREESPFEIVYNLYSISANERVRLNVATREDGVESVTSVWPAANWMEREVYDLFGVRFKNHPDLRRLLLPPDWEGHPLRKDVSLEFVENAWTKQHLPEMTDVQREQLEQRRAYGLEILSVPEERMMREILQAGKEVMPKDK